MVPGGAETTLQPRDPLHTLLWAGTRSQWHANLINGCCLDPNHSLPSAALPLTKGAACHSVRAVDIQGRGLTGWCEAGVKS